ncbi:MAG: InlB B-repeat-containing protein, partial [Bacteroidales bacterium]|nr:InlB B-repeat-containing protein [Bacteroidales bacterium]
VTDNEGGNYTVNGSEKFTIKPYEIAADDPNLTITLNPTEFIYDGTAKEPVVTVTYLKGTETITISADEYSVSYKDNVNAGTATAIVTDNAGGNYTINGEKQFTILPVFTVTFATEHGTAPAPLERIVIGSKIDAPADRLTATGYTFTGEWYVDKEFKSIWNFQKNVVENDLTLYARWTNDTIFITATNTDPDGTIVADASNEYFCNGKAVIDFTVQNGTPQNYRVEFDGDKIPAQQGAISDNRIEINLPKSLTPGVYSGSLVLTSDDGKSSDILPLRMVVRLPLYSIVTLYNDVAAVNDLAGNFTAYQWTENSQPISGANDRLLQYRFNKSSVYTAILTFDDGSRYETCPLDMSRIVTSKTTALRVYPNPANALSDITIEVSENFMPDANKRIYIYNLNGTLAKQINTPEEINKVQLPKGSYSGVYIQDGEKVPFKLIVK